MENSHALFDTGKELLLGQYDQGRKMVLGHRSELLGPCENHSHRDPTGIPLLANLILKFLNLKE